MKIYNFVIKIGKMNIKNLKIDLKITFQGFLIKFVI